MLVHVQIHLKPHMMERNRQDRVIKPKPNAIPTIFKQDDHNSNKKPHHRALKIIQVEEKVIKYKTHKTFNKISYHCALK